MYEAAHGRHLARLLAVLLGVLFWLPALGPKLPQLCQPAVACADAGGSSVGELAVDDIAPSQAPQGEETEDGKKNSASSCVGGQLCGSRRSSGAGSIRVGVAEYERERLSAAHDVLARERGPPVV
jgi:hypothetical protein